MDTAPPRVPFAPSGCPIFTSSRACPIECGSTWDEQNLLEFDECPVGALPILSGGLTFEFSPSAWRSQVVDSFPCLQSLDSSHNRAHCPLLSRNHREVVQQSTRRTKGPRQHLGPHSETTMVRSGLPRSSLNRYASNTMSTRTGAFNFTTITSRPSHEPTRQLFRYRHIPRFDVTCAT